MNSISRNVAILIRAERHIAQRRFASLRRTVWFMIPVAVLAFIGCVAVAVAGYLFLETLLAPPLAALAVGVVCLLVAGGVFLAAGRTNDIDAEISAISEVRDLAMEDLEAELGAATDEVRDLARSVRKITRNPLGAALPGIVVPLLTLLTKQLKK